MKRFPDSISFSLAKKNSSLPQVYIHRYEQFFSSKSSNFTHPAFGAEIESKVGHYPWFYTNNQLRKALSFFWDQVRLGVEKKGHSNHESCFCWGCFGMEDLL